MRIPGIGVQRRAEPEPADDAQADNRDDDAPDGDAAELSGDARAAKVSDGADPEHADGRQPNLHRGQRRAKQLCAVTDSGNGNRHIGDQQRHAIGIVRHKVTGLTKRIFGIAAHPAGLAAEHAALGKRPRQRHRTHGGNKPGDNRNRPHFSELGGEHDDPRTHHIHHGENSELHHAHLVGLTHNFSPFSSDG